MLQHKGKPGMGWNWNTSRFLTHGRNHISVLESKKTHKNPTNDSNGYILLRYQRVLFTALRKWVGVHWSIKYQSCAFKCSSSKKLQFSPATEKEREHKPKRRNTFVLVLICGSRMMIGTSSPGDCGTTCCFLHPFRQVVTLTLRYLPSHSRCERYW